MEAIPESTTRRIDLRSCRSTTARRTGPARSIDAYVAHHPDRIIPFHREGGAPGKAVALGEAMALVDSEVVLILDSDYLPGRDIIE